MLEEADFDQSGTVERSEFIHGTSYVDKITDNSTKRTSYVDKGTDKLD